MGTTILLALGVGAVTYLGGRLFNRADTRVEERRRNAATAATWLSEEGFEHLPNFLVDYSVGDYGGALTRLRQWVNEIRSDETRKALLDGVFSKQLAIRLRDDKRRTEILTAVDQLRREEQAKQAEAEAAVRAKIAAENVSA